MRSTAILLLLALLSACGGEKGKMRLSGELSGLRQGDILVWNTDGMGTEAIDTIHIQSGRLEYEAPATDEVSAWTLLYPNYSTLTIFGSSGDVLKLSGKANELRRVEVKGSEDNELYTAYRLGEITADSLIAAHPATAVARHVFKTEYVNAKKCNRAVAARLYGLLRKAQPTNRELASWAPFVSARAPLAVGAKMQPFTAVTAKGDTLTLDTFRGKRLVIGVWSSWDVRSRELVRTIRRERRKDKKLEAITVNVDTDPQSRATFERLDSITWHRVNSTRLFAHPLLRQWGIVQAPYAIVIDTAGVVRAFGADVEKIMQQ